MVLAVPSTTYCSVFILSLSPWPIWRRKTGKQTAPKERARQPTYVALHVHSTTLQVACPRAKRFDNRSTAVATFMVLAVAGRDRASQHGAANHGTKALWSGYTVPEEKETSHRQQYIAWPWYAGTLERGPRRWGWKYSVGHCFVFLWQVGQSSSLFSDKFQTLAL
jgi:hypothetical protein